MKILVATNDLTFSVSLSHAYAKAGHDVRAGIPELYLGLQAFDLVHLHWPEELTGWEMPPPVPQIQRVLGRLDVLHPNTKLVCTAHNLLPHGDRDGSARALYDQFYGRMDAIGHFSESSRGAVTAAFPDVPAERHFVHGMNDFADLRVHQIGRDRARQLFGIKPDAVAIAAIGSIRSLDELSLIAAASDAAVPKLHIVRAFREPAVHGLAERFRRKQLRRRLDSKPNTMIEGFLPDTTLVTVCEAADIIIIPRIKDQLNSGVLALAMTFGTPLMAPDCGVFREVLAGSANGLYAPGNAKALTHIVETMAKKNLPEVRQQNLSIAASWGWDRAVPKIMGALS